MSTHIICFLGYLHHMFASLNKKNCQFRDKYVWVGQVDFDIIYFSGNK